MQYLLDTHVLLWWLSDHPQLLPSTKELIANPDHVIYVSSVSIWEISIKTGLGKLTVPADYYNAIEAAGFAQLNVTHAHALQVAQLPNQHDDPFDRLLIAQALSDNLTLITHDQLFAQYPVKCVFN